MLNKETEAVFMFRQLFVRGEQAKGLYLESDLPDDREKCGQSAAQNDEVGQEPDRRTTADSP